MRRFSAEPAILVKSRSLKDRPETGSIGLDVVVIPYPGGAATHFQVEREWLVVLLLLKVAKSDEQENTCIE
jgi:hypothetical protein